MKGMNMIKTILRKFPVVLACFFLAATAWAAPVVVVLSRTAEPYTQMLEGFKHSYEGMVTVANMEGIAQKGLQAMQACHPGEVAAVIAVGSEAAQAGAGLDTSIPLIFSMLRDPIRLPKRVPAGVILEISVADQFEQIRQLFPDRKRIGIIYNPANSGDQISQARELMDRFGFKLTILSADSAAEVPADLARMPAGSLDLIWMVPDETMAQPAVLKLLITHSLQEKLPLIGFSPYQVKAGVYAAFSADYQEIGIQTAALAKRMLAGGPAAVETPRKVSVCFNPTVQRALQCEDLSKVKDVRIVQ
jgi:putative ABC transport system substrate-binding protein